MGAGGAVEKRLAHSFLNIVNLLGSRVVDGNEMISDESAAT
jgi:hypothetical protein